MNILQIAIAFDQLVNTLVGGAADETLSARAHRQHLKGRSAWRVVINALFFWQLDHCKEAYQAELLRTQYPEEYRSASK